MGTQWLKHGTCRQKKLTNRQLFVAIKIALGIYTHTHTHTHKHTHTFTHTHIHVHTPSFCTRDATIWLNTKLSIALQYIAIFDCVLFNL